MNIINSDAFSSTSTNNSERYRHFKFALPRTHYRKDQSFYDQIFDPRNGVVSYYVGRQEKTATGKFILLLIIINYYLGFIHIQSFVTTVDRYTSAAFRDKFRIKFAVGMRDEEDIAGAIRYVDKVGGS